MERATILLVDDDDALRDGMARLLRHDYHVLHAGSADEALEVLRTVPVDVILADHHMPGLSGLDLLRLARDRHPDAARIMLTGHAEPSVVIRATNEGEVDRFLVKPVDAAELKVTLHVVLEQLREDREARHLRTLVSVRPGLARRLETSPGLPAQDDPAPTGTGGGRR